MRSCHRGDNNTVDPVVKDNSDIVTVEAHDNSDSRLLNSRAALQYTDLQSSSCSLAQHLNCQRNPLYTSRVPLQSPSQLQQQTTNQLLGSGQMVVGAWIQRGHVTMVSTQVFLTVSPHAPGSYPSKVQRLSVPCGHKEVDWITWPRLSLFTVIVAIYSLHQASASEGTITMSLWPSRS